MWPRSPSPQRRRSPTWMRPSSTVVPSRPSIWVWKSKIRGTYGRRHLTAGAVARLIEHGSRLASDAQRLTTQTGPLDDLIGEADHFAAQANAPLIGREHVETALAAQRRRLKNVIREKDIVSKLQHFDAVA